MDSLARDRAKVSKSKGKREENDATAGLVGLTDRGTLAPGKRADLLVLDANPLDDIRNTRRIAKLYLAGVEVDRAALKASLTGSARQ